MIIESMLIPLKKMEKKKIIIYGGLIRQKYLDVEGLSIILSRQTAQLNGIGYHYGNNIKNPLCEVSADYGTLVPLRNYFDGKVTTHWHTITNVGMKQLQEFFEGLPVNGVPEPTKCSHFNQAEDYTCRIKTMIAGNCGDDIPDCYLPVDSNNNNM